jgi:hypothetical protein
MPPRGAALLLLLVVLCGASLRFLLVSSQCFAFFSGSSGNAGANSSAGCVLAVGSRGMTCVASSTGLVRGRRWFRLLLRGAVALVIPPSASESCLRLSHVEVGIPSEKNCTSILFGFGAAAAGELTLLAWLSACLSRTSWVVKTACVDMTRATVWCERSVFCLIWSSKFLGFASSFNWFKCQLSLDSTLP